NAIEEKGIEASRDNVMDHNGPALISEPADERSQVDHKTKSTQPEEKKLESDQASFDQSESMETIPEPSSDESTAEDLPHIEDDAPLIDDSIEDSSETFDTQEKESDEEELPKFTFDDLFHKED